MEKTGHQVVSGELYGNGHIAAESVPFSFIPQTNSTLRITRKPQLQLSFKLKTDYVYSIALHCYIDVILFSNIFP